jgi:hypothetical protein
MRGELRWSERNGDWEVLIRSAAFKNSGSSFFGKKPFRLILSGLVDLYKYRNAYIDRYRGVLLRSAQDPGTLLVKTVKTTSKDAAYAQTTFYEAWRLVIERYGNCSPYIDAGRSRVCYRMDRTMSVMCWQPISSSRPAPTSRQAMRFRTRPTWCRSTMAASCRRTRQRWPRAF